MILQMKKLPIIGKNISYDFGNELYNEAININKGLIKD